MSEAEASLPFGEAEATLPFVPEFFVVIQKSVPFKVHYLLRETCSIGGAGSKNRPHRQRIKT
jgi:hypothetical protein